LGQAQSLIATVDGAAAAQVTTGKLATGTMYYWRVDSVVNDANAAEGEVWDFTTLVEPVEVCHDADINGDCRVDFGDLLLIAEQWLDGPGCEGHAYCADLSGADGVNLDDFVRLATQWRASVGPVVINEIHYDPPVKTELAEFVELHNVTKQPIDLSGWSLTSGVDCVLPPGTWIGAGGCVVIAQDAEKFEARFGFAPDGVFTSRLSNDGETVRLRNPAREIIDEVTYKLGFPWPTVGDLPGNSIQLINPGIDNDLGGSWRSAPPSPGEVNVVLSTHMPPHMRQVKHSPQAPGSNEPVTITVKVTDDDGVASVTLSYQVVDPNAYISIGDAAYNADWVSVAMHDDGTNGDVEAGDSIYTVIMPASMQVHRRLVRYRITAVDALGLAITGPYSDDPCPNFAYFVYDGPPAWTAAINPWAGQPEYITYGVDVMRSLPVYHLISKKSDVETATWFEHYEGSEYKWQGTLVYDGQVYDHIRYRMRGGIESLTGAWYAMPLCTSEWAGVIKPSRRILMPRSLHQLSRSRQRYEKPASLPRLRLHPDRPIQPRQDPLGDRQAQTFPCRLGLHLRPVENVEYPVSLFGRHADAVVLHAINAPAILHLAANADSPRPVVIEVFQGVAHKIAEHLLNLRAVAATPRQRLHRHLRFAGFDLECHTVQDLVNQGFTTGENNDGRRLPGGKAGAFVSRKGAAAVSRTIVKRRRLVER